MKHQRVAEVIRNWCGQRPAPGSRLQGLWETHGPRGVSFDDEGADRLICELEREFPGHGLQPGDVLRLTVDGLIDAIPDSVVEPVVAFTLAARRVAGAAPETGTPAVVSLSDETIERLSTMIARFLDVARPSGAALAGGRSSRAKTARKSAKGSSTGGRRKVR